MIATADVSPIDSFIERWAKSSGAERANFPMFAVELCQLLSIEAPQPSVGERVESNDYCFERRVDFKSPDGTKSVGRIDLYKRGCFVMEAKQSRETGRPKEVKVKGQPDLFIPELEPRGQRSAGQAWNQLMQAAHRQAQEYARALPVDHGWPPFVIVCDVGHCFEVFADFSGQGKNYSQFPDRQGFRIYLSELHDPEVQKRLRLIFQDPHALDPARQSAKVTREIASRLAVVSKGLEKRGEPAEDVALFLMRCLFTMFAEDVELLPKESFQKLLEEAARDADQFKPMVEQLWTAMDKGEFAFALRQQVRRFNGKLFKEAKALALRQEEIGELAVAAKYNWREVEPAIFGTLLEQALDAEERARLGAHYTPRAYVERLVVVTVMEPLRQEWAQVQATAERLKSEGKGKDAVAVVRSYHERLCDTRVLDPACGTGNFLYVAMELMKRLEGEVLEALADLGGQEALALDKLSVDPHQFLGIEKNPRAAAIAELVIWLGYLQWHFRTKGGTPSEPILRDFKNIKVKDAVLMWDGYPEPHVEMKDGKRVETYPNPRKPDWWSKSDDEPHFIVGNPPFIGGKDIRASLGDGYTAALWAAHKDINDSADFVMYWWDRAAEIVAKSKRTQRFGFVTTNSITQMFSRRVVANHLEAKKPISLLMAIPDHPWTKATDKAAAVRIAMTVATAGRHQGVLREVEREAGLDTDQPDIEFSTRVGRINSDLTVGANLQDVVELASNSGLSSRGMSLHGAGFIVSPSEAEALGLGKREGLERHIRPYRNGRDLMATPRGVMVIDFFGLDADDVRRRYPEVYQHLLQTVKSSREAQHAKSPTRDAKEYLDRWWTHGKPREQLRPALAGLKRYIATVETSKHRVFQFLNASILPDNKLVAIGLSDAYFLGVISSRAHMIWYFANAGKLGVYKEDAVYVKTRCFDPFPFPICSADTASSIRVVADELDAHRKARQTEHPRLTMTQMYNVLEKLKAGEPLDSDDERIKSEGLVLILKELHEKLDALVFDAYGWPASLTDEEILARLVALNRERAEEETRGLVRWLRPDYQIPRFGSETEQARLDDERRKARGAERTSQRQDTLDFDDDLQDMKPKFPTEDELAETAAVMRVLATSPRPLSIQDVARHFSQGLKVEKRVALTILALARLGHLSSPDAGETFLLRMAA